METSRESSNFSEKVASLAPAQLQELESRVARRRLSQARHRATLAGLFSSLRKTLYSQSDLTPSKWQVLNKAKSHIQELEQNLDNLLKLKESFNLEDGNANSLEEVKKEYVNMYSRNQSLVLNQVLQKGSATWCPTEAPEKDTEEEEEGEEEDQEEDEDEEKGEEEKVELPHSPAASPPDPLEFERYLSFYKQTMDLLTANGIVSSQEVTLPIVSAAISHLWQNLSETRKASLLQVWAQIHSSLPGLAGACQESACAEGSMKDSGVESQGASCSLTSTPEEILLEDTFDVASFLDKSETPSTSSSSSAFAGCNPENPEEKFQLYMQIINYFKGLPAVNFQIKQEPDLPIDDEMIMLRCMETFDDDEDL
ncbi:stimulated by retinoic acid gene 8 protein homolog [Manis javanica]|uniref:stimulated by retinoic acid gene 8 protein homolog n=1 Tax=Manis javanica TaxID=9974 RepID=UPI000813D142